jgi:hypothetical protein
VDVRVIKTEKQASASKFHSETFLEALIDLIKQLGYDERNMTPNQKGVVADKLSRVAGQEPAWTWRYVHNVMGRKIDTSKAFNAAIYNLLAVLDGSNPMMANAKKVQLFVVGNVSPNALVLADSRPCANPKCPIEFVPKYHFQTHCCPACTTEHTIMKKAARRAQRKAPA